MFDMVYRYESFISHQIAMFIGAIGILDRRDMDHFSKIFIAYQTLAKSKDEDGTPFNFRSFKVSVSLTIST